MTTARIIPDNQTPHPNSCPRFRPGRNEAGFALIMALVFLILLTLLGVLALNSSDFENMFAASVQQAEVNFSVAEGGNALEASNLGFNKRDWYLLKDTETDAGVGGRPMVPITGQSYNAEQAYNPGGRKKPNFLNDGGTYTLADDYVEDEAREKPRMWPFGNLRAKEEKNKDGRLMVSIKEEDGYNTDADRSYDYRYLVTYMGYDLDPVNQGTSKEMGGAGSGFSTYYFRIQTSPVVVGSDKSSVSEGRIVETAGFKYGQQTGTATTNQ